MEFINNLNNIKPIYTPSIHFSQDDDGEMLSAFNLKIPTLSSLHSPFSDNSINGELQSTHNQIIELQDKLIDMKDRRIDRVKFQPHDLTDTDLVSLSEEHPASYI